MTNLTPMTAYMLLFTLGAIAGLIIPFLLPSRRSRDRGDIHKALTAAAERRTLNPPREMSQKAREKWEQDRQRYVARRLAQAGVVFVHMRLKCN